MTDRMLFRLIEANNFAPELLSSTEFDWLIEKKLLRWEGDNVEITEFGKRALQVALERVDQFVNLMVKHDRS